MTLHGSASAQEETPHETETIQITISDALRRRAQSVIYDRSIDPQWRSIIRYALEISDPLLPDLVRRADAGEKIIETTEFAQTQESDEDDSHEEKIAGWVRQPFCTSPHGCAPTGYRRWY